MYDVLTQLLQLPGTPLSKTGVPIIPILIAGKGKPGSVCENRVEALQLSFSLENEKVILQ